MSELVITRNNFSNMRNAYGITLKEVAEKADLSESTVRAFDTNDISYSGTHARDYNEKKMCRVLKEIIDLKLDTIFEAPVKKKKACYNITQITRAQAMKTIENYCAANSIKVKEFYEMIGCHYTTFSPCLIKKYPHLSKSLVTKICSITGWTEEELANGVTTLIKKDIPKQEEAVKKEEKPGRPIYNKQLIAADGKYYIEYDIYVLEHKREEVTMEQFIEEAKKC